MKKKLILTLLTFIIFTSTCLAGTVNTQIEYKPLFYKNNNYVSLTDMNKLGISVVTIDGKKKIENNYERKLKLTKYMYQCAELLQEIERMDGIVLSECLNNLQIDYKYISEINTKVATAKIYLENINSEMSYLKKEDKQKASIIYKDLSNSYLAESKNLQYMLKEKNNIDLDEMIVMSWEYGDWFERLNSVDDLIYSF